MSRHVMGVSLAICYLAEGETLGFRENTKTELRGHAPHLVLRQAWIEENQPVSFFSEIL